MENRLADKKAQGIPSYGTFTQLKSAAAVENIACAPFDFVVIDTEHQAFGTDLMASAVASAQSAGLTRREVTAALESVMEPISLEEPIYTDGGDAMYVIDQVRDPDGEDSWISGLQFRQTVAGLTPREKRIMELRYLQGKTQMEVAREIGISQAQVSRLEKGALEQFHHMG